MADRGVALMPSVLSFKVASWTSSPTAYPPQDWGVAKTTPGSGGGGGGGATAPEVGQIWPRGVMPG